MKKNVGILIITIMIIGFAIFSFKWIKHRIDYAITDAVFVENDNLITLSFKRISGKIIKFGKNEGDFIKKGEIIAKIDDTDYKIQLEKLEKEIKSLEYKKQLLISKKNRIKSQLKINTDISSLNLKQINQGILAVKAQISAVNSQIVQLEKDRKRFENLVKKQLAPEKKLEDINTNLKVLVAKRDALYANLEKLLIQNDIAKKNIKLAKIKQRQVIELEKQIKSLEEKINSLYVSKKDIQNLISYTHLKAPFDGIIAKKFKKEGELVSSGMPVLSIIPKDGFYINALLEETKLEGIKEGNKVLIKIDAYPDENFEGVVEKINPAVASKFALVPRDITAGEFTKVAQRIPIRIKITKGNTALLRAGLSGEVEIKREK